MLRCRRHHFCLRSFEYRACIFWTWRSLNFDKYPDFGRYCHEFWIYQEIMYKHCSLTFQLKTYSITDSEWTRWRYACLSALSFEASSYYSKSALIASCWFAIKVLIPNCWTQLWLGHIGSLLFLSLYFDNARSWLKLSEVTWLFQYYSISYFYETFVHQILYKDISFADFWL